MVTVAFGLSLFSSAVAQSGIGPDSGRSVGEFRQQTASDDDPEPEAEDASVTEANKKDDDFMDPRGGAMSLGDGEGFGLGTAIGDPSALNGPDRDEVVLDGSIRASAFSITGYYVAKPAENQRFIFQTNFDPTFLGTDISYAWKPEGWEGVLTANMFLSSAHFASFHDQTPVVRLPNLEQPYLQQGGFGIEYAQEMTEDLDIAVALNYQNFAFSDSLLGGSRFARDFTGTPLTLGENGTGDLYTLAFEGVYNAFDEPAVPTQGTKIRFGFEQAFGMGLSSTAYSRFGANLTQIVPMPGFNSGKHSLVLNVQAGTVLGDDVPQIRGFHLGGPFSVRGYELGEMASGTSFAQGSLEYRHHLTKFAVAGFDIDMRASAFVDYGSVLGTQRRLRGMPEYLYERPESGTGYGVGLNFATDFGLLKLETAWTNDGRQSTYFTIGERF